MQTRAKGNVSDNFSVLQCKVTHLSRLRLGTGDFTKETETTLVGDAGSERVSIHLKVLYFKMVAFKNSREKVRALDSKQCSQAEE